MLLVDTIQSGQNAEAFFWSELVSFKNIYCGLAAACIYRIKIDNAIKNFLFHV